MDFIPLNAKKKKGKINMKSSKKRRLEQDKTSKRPRDTQLYGRVKQVVGGNLHKAIDEDSVAEELRKLFPEYRRKKVNEFRSAVSSILKFAQESAKSQQDEESSQGSSDFSGDMEDLTSYPDSNLVNQSISTLYQNSPKPDVNGTPKSPASTKRKESEDEKFTEEKSLKKMKKEKQPEKKPNVKKKKELVLQESHTTFSDVGGIEKVQEEMWELLVQMRQPEIYEHLGVLPPRGYLLHGPPGSGKTLLAHAIAGELQIPMLKMAATELVTGVSGESEELIRQLFEQALASAPCILFIDEIDAITPKRETAQREMERRIVAQLLICLDDLSQKDASTRLLVIGATNRADSIDPALRRAGRFDHEISLGIPDEESRIMILKVLCQKLKLHPSFNIVDLAHRSPGYVGADLMALTRKAATCAIKRILDATHCKRLSENAEADNQASYSPWFKNFIEPSSTTEDTLRNVFIEQEDFLVALKSVQPSAKREGFATVPDTTWEDIGALQDIREELQLAILAPVSHKSAFEALGLTTSAGILLCGPPGCGKTLLAKAIANESGLNFISVKGPELLNMYVGESERAVRQCFQRARNAAPCVIFFDELDALCPRRTKDSAVSGASDRVVNQLLTEMDGMDSRKQVFVLAATNRPDIIDPAIIRPGRLDKVLYVGLPSPKDRVEILRTVTKNGSKPPLDEDVSLENLGNDERCEGFTGADLNALVREASSLAIKQLMLNPQTMGIESLKVKACHFDDGFKKIRPSVSQQDQKIYEKMQSKSALPSSL